MDMESPLDFFGPILDLVVIFVSYCITLLVTRKNNKKQSYNNDRKALFEALLELRNLVLDRYQDETVLTKQEIIKIDNKISCLLTTVCHCHNELLKKSPHIEKGDKKIRSYYVKMRQAASLDVGGDAKSRILKLDEYTNSARSAFPEKH